MRPSDGGANFGWRVFEGTAIFNGTPVPGMVAAGGRISARHRPARGQFGDRRLRLSRPGRSASRPICLRRFRQRQPLVDPDRPGRLGTTIPSSQFILRRADFAPNLGTINNIASFGVDQAGNLYIVDFDGEIFRIEPA